MKNKVTVKKEKKWNIPKSLLNATKYERDNCICAEWGEGRSTCGFPCPIHFKKDEAPSSPKPKGKESRWGKNDVYECSNCGELHNEAISCPKLYKPKGKENWEEQRITEIINSHSDFSEILDKEGMIEELLEFIDKTLNQQIEEIIKRLPKYKKGIKEYPDTVRIARVYNSAIDEVIKILKEEI